MSKKILRVAMIGPLGGASLAPGLIKMSNEINSWIREGYLIQARFFNWSAWESAADWLNTADIRVAIGYSNGGSSATWIPYGDADTLPCRLDLLIGLDPTIWIKPALIPINVKKAVCYYNANWFILVPTQLVGHAKYYLTDNNKVTNLITRTIWDWHGNVDNNPQRQAEIYSMIKALIR
jgi:hypothetical protein